ncbi:hypothetical protein KCU88_g258, partial [Aureobasidium melanogenum]
MVAVQAAEGWWLVQHCNQPRPVVALVVVAGFYTCSLAMDADEPEEATQKGKGGRCPPAWTVWFAIFAPPSHPVVVTVKVLHGTKGGEEGQCEEHVDHGETCRVVVEGKDKGGTVQNGQCRNDLGPDKPGGWIYWGVLIVTFGQDTAKGKRNGTIPLYVTLCLQQIRALCGIVGELSGIDSQSLPHSAEHDTGQSPLRPGSGMSSMREISEEFEIRSWDKPSLVPLIGLCHWHRAHLLRGPASLSLDPLLNHNVGPPH